jgi:hypothetical protein
MPFVKLIEQDRAYALQFGIGQHLAQQQPFSHITNPCGG